jgi:hypothetical protein
MKDRTRIGFIVPYNNLEGDSMKCYHEGKLRVYWNDNPNPTLEDVDPNTLETEKKKFIPPAVEKKVKKLNLLNKEHVQVQIKEFMNKLNGSDGESREELLQHILYGGGGTRTRKKPKLFVQENFVQAREYKALEVARRKDKIAKEREDEEKQKKVDDKYKEGHKKRFITLYNYGLYITKWRETYIEYIKGLYRFIEHVRGCDNKATCINKDHDEHHYTKLLLWKLDQGDQDETFLKVKEAVGNLFKPRGNSNTNRTTLKELLDKIECDKPLEALEKLYDPLETSREKIIRKYRQEDEEKQNEERERNRLRLKWDFVARNELFKNLNDKVQKNILTEENILHDIKKFHNIDDVLDEEGNLSHEKLSDECMERLERLSKKRNTKIPKKRK